MTRFLAAVLAWLPLAATAQAAGVTAPFSVAQNFAWLEGCWAFERDGKRYEERWDKPAYDRIAGRARTLQDGRVRFREETDIRTVDWDHAEYVARPQGQKETAFRLVKIETEAGRTTAVFENPAHDFPTRITYTRTLPDRLDAAIEGPDGAQRRDYPFRRVDCTTLFRDE